MKTCVAARGSYDLVLLETAPVLPVAETRAVAAMRIALLVVRLEQDTGCSGG